MEGRFISSPAFAGLKLLRKAIAMQIADLRIAVPGPGTLHECGGLFAVKLSFIVYI
jgi:hypothetical protein